MIGQGRPWAAIAVGAVVGIAMMTTAVQADPFSPDKQVAPSSAKISISPMFDDANLHAVRFIGTKVGWAVGDHGVIWKTMNAGQNWSLIPSPVTCPLRSIFFLTDRIGWIAGGGTVPYSRVGYGVLLFTQDGGQSWRILAADKRGLRNPQLALRKLIQQQGPGQRGPAKPWARLPQLHFVKFFGLTHGVAVGESSRDFPTGVMTTTNGGQTWNAVVGKKHTGWRAADFVNPQVGVVAGLRGEISLVGSGRMLKPAIDATGLRTYRDVTLHSNETGWMVGDGGLVLKTENGGVSWKPSAGQLPRNLREVTDFHTVAMRGKNVWIAGRPGSVIWHSANNGQSWTKQITGQTIPIHSLWFSTPTDGWAVGALGLILHTADAGKTWTALRGEGRRIALMAVHGETKQISFPLIVKQSADLGYRSLVLLPSRRDVGPDGHSVTGIDLELPEAITAAGGSGGSFGWQFPIAIPGLDRDESKLLADWKNRSEGRLREVFLGRLVSQLRTWRPSVIVIDQPTRENALTKVINQALMQAVQLAGDPTAFIQHAELAGLRPWKVQKIYWRLPAGSTGQAHISPHEYLPRLGATVAFVSSSASSRIHAARSKPRKREAYSLILDRQEGVLQSSAVGDIFSRLKLSPGSASRRNLLTWNEKDAEARRKVAQRQRNFQAYSERALNDPRQAAQLIAQLGTITAGMSRQQAALQILTLANDYKRRAQWELAEAAMIELVSRYPEAPSAIEGMQWLFQLWTGAEPVWQRVRQISVGRIKLRSDFTSFHQRLEHARKLLRIPAMSRDLSAVELDPDPVRFLTAPESNPADRNTQRRMKGVRHWNNQALQLASLIRKVDTEKYQSPEIQFPLAALLRARGASRVADRYYRRYQIAGKDDPWKATADSEIWMIAPRGQPPKKFVAGRSVETRPVLDGVLGDACWRNAQSIPLTPPKNGGPVRVKNAFVLVAYDAEYLYIAGNVPRAAGLPKDLPTRKGRQHDADLSKYDRVSFLLDVDRDYVSYYKMTIDQRGFTAESCFGNSAWNPKWFVATDADETTWRFEAAIPWKELVPRAPVRNNAWAFGVIRTMPGVGLQSWTHPMGSTPRPESFGFLRFE